MKSVNTWRNSLLVLLVALIATGCATTIVPRPVVDQQASFDGNEANSGFLRFNADGSGVITSRARERYNALIARYGDRFTVPLKPDAGLKPIPGTGTWEIAAEYLVKFATMNRWRKEATIHVGRPAK